MTHFIYQGSLTAIPVKTTHNTVDFEDMDSTQIMDAYNQFLGEDGEDLTMEEFDLRVDEMSDLEKGWKVEGDSINYI